MERARAPAPIAAPSAPTALKDMRKLSNQLLRGLGASRVRGLAPPAEVVILRRQQVLYEPGDPIEHVYFPCGAVVSLGAVMSDGTFIQSALVGWEGMVGASSILLGASRVPGRALCHVGGPVKRMMVRDLGRAMQRIPVLRQRVERHTQALLVQLNQSAGCNSVHTIEQRIARWLLMTHDRVGANSFRQTQEFLAATLGVRRASVSVAAAHMQAKGLIRYSRGQVTIVDRRGLTAVACECYGIIRRAYQRLDA